MADDGLVNLAAAAAEMGGDGSPANLDRSGGSLQISGQFSTALLRDLELDIEIYRRVLSVCVKLTRPEHWFARKSAAGDLVFSLQGPGAEALCTPFGIDWERPVQKTVLYEDERGKYHAIETVLEMHSSKLGRRGFFLGYCDTRDEFFMARARTQAVNAYCRLHRKPVDSLTAAEHTECERYARAYLTIGDIQKASFTNALVAGVTRMLGIRNPDRVILEGAGLDISRIPGIRYNTKEEGGGSSRENVAGGTKSTISEAQSKRLYAIARDGVTKALGDGDHSAKIAELLDGACLHVGVSKTREIAPAAYDAAEQFIRTNLQEIKR